MIFNVCDCTWGCADTIRQSALKVDSGRNIPRCSGESNLCQQCASLMLDHLSYIPSAVNILDCGFSAPSEPTHVHYLCAKQG